MKMICAAVVIFASCSVFAETTKECVRCDEIAALEKKVIEQLPKQEPDTAKYDVEAAKIINSMGKISSAQADQIVRYLKQTLPTDPAQGMIESIWPAISKNWDTLENAAKKLSKEEIEIVWVPVQHYANSLKHGQDPVPSKKSKK